jgi:2-isopropylmalate synthase
MENVNGYVLPKAMHPEFGRLVKAYCDEKSREITAAEVNGIFEREYINVAGPYALLSHKLHDERDDSGNDSVRFSGKIKHGAAVMNVEGFGNGPIDAFFNALGTIGVNGYEFVDYAEHAISVGSDAKAVSYIRLRNKEGKNLFGVGVSRNINYASIKAVLCAVNRGLGE